MTTVPHPRPTLSDFARHLVQGQRPAHAAPALFQAKPHLRLVTAAVARVGGQIKTLKQGPRGPKKKYTDWSG